MRSPDHSYSDQLAAREKEASRLRAQIAVCAACGAFTDSRQLYLLSVHALRLVTRFCPMLTCIIRNTVIEYEKRRDLMPVKQPKKLLIMNILDILRKYSDEEHRLSQKDIAEILKTEYDMTADRTAIRRNILTLMDCGYNIEYSESIRMVPNPKTGQPVESYLWSDFYLERDFTDGELRLLIDGLLFSKHIPYSQCKELVNKLEGLSNVYFRSRVKHIARLPEDKTDNKQLFLTIELLDEAISRGRRISFKYLEYGTDKRQHSKIRPDGTERVYIISPYQMAAKEGKYYLRRCWSPSACRKRLKAL